MVGNSEDLKTKLKTEFTHFNLLSDIGTDSFCESIKWLKESVERFENNEFSVGAEDIERDARRALSTYRNKVLTKIKMCKLSDIEKNESKELNKKLLQFIHDLIGDVSMFEDGFKTGENVLTSVLNVDDQTDNLLKFLGFVKDRRKSSIYQVIGVENQEATCVQTESFVSDLESAKASNHDFVLVEDDNGKRRNQSGEELHEGSSSGPNSRTESVPNIENTTPIRNINNQCSHDLPKSVVEATIPNFSKILFEQKDIRTVVIGNIPWKLACQYHRNDFVVILICEWDQPSYTCIARTRLQVLSQGVSSARNNWEKIATIQWDDETRRCHYRIKVTELSDKSRCFIKNDTILIKMNVDILATTGIPTIDTSYFNPEYELIEGTVTHTFPNVSGLKENEPMLESEAVTFGGYPWKLVMNRKYVHLVCNYGADARYWSCDAKVEFRVITGSARDPVYLSTGGFNFATDHFAFEEVNLSWINIMREARNYLSDDGLTIIATITIFKKKNN